jgi:hypothetical protein
MTPWVLIVFLVGVGYSTSSSTLAVDMQTEQACRLAADNVRVELHAGHVETHAICIYRGGHG